MNAINEAKSHFTNCSDINSSVTSVDVKLPKTTIKAHCRLFIKIDYDYENISKHRE